jgi:hypothetical protein
MKILLLGVGLQGKAALYHLVNSSAVAHIVAADVNYGNLSLMSIHLRPIR